MASFLPSPFRLGGTRGGFGSGGSGILHVHSFGSHTQFRHPIRSVWQGAGVGGARTLSRGSIATGASLGEVLGGVDLGRRFKWGADRILGGAVRERERGVAWHVRFSVSGAGTSGGFPREPLESEDLHRVEPLLVLPKGSFILTGGEVARTLGLTSVVTSSVVESYDESVDAEVWGEGIAHHTALMARVATVRLARRPDASTSDANMAVDLAAELAQT
ncbi:hypothetical protein B296_00023688 [Ensete ventricosum]|uniref:Uncharacterized protein n=1 Tax=Ensete ventricosum TaxID=4639 RepID=A0A427AC84_ENSVE|nr:hypothetical protein B296_00023688 [Ensete ventricosum]